MASSKASSTTSGPSRGEYRDVWYEMNFVTRSDWPTSSWLATIVAPSFALTSTSTSNIAGDTTWCRTAHASDILLFVHW